MRMLAAMEGAKCCSFNCLANLSFVACSMYDNSVNTYGIAKHKEHLVESQAGCSTSRAINFNK